MANSIEPDQMALSVASDLDLHSLLRPVCLRLPSHYILNRDQLDTDQVDPHQIDQHQITFTLGLI